MSNSTFRFPVTWSKAPGLRGKKITTLKKDEHLEFLQALILNELSKKDPIYVLDLGVATSLFHKWTSVLPMVTPFYAVKCNPNPAFLGALAVLGCNFDCASQAEIASVLSLGVSPFRIIFANPCKMESHNKYAARVGVDLATFDSINELEKLRKWHPKCSLLIRIKPPGNEEGARSCLGSKYGALPEEVTPLLKAAHAAKLHVVGVSFHIGSENIKTESYGEAIAAAREVFDTAEKLCMAPMNVLDIGGGFMAGPKFDEAASNVKAALQEHFPNTSDLQIIAEPGRLFAEKSFTLLTNIFGKRLRGEVREYWINDGIYGSMSCLWNGHISLNCAPLACSSNPENPTCEGAKTYDSTIFGPTCDALDTVFKGKLLPELQVDDWLGFPNMGAYAAAAGSSFNGYRTQDIVTYITQTE